MRFIVQLISFFLLLVAMGLKAAKDGLKNFNWGVSMTIFSQAQLIFKDFRKKWTEFRNEWKEIDYKNVNVQVKENFVFLEDRDLEYLLEDTTDAVINFVQGGLRIVSVVARFKAYFNTEDISNKPSLEK